MQESGRTGHVLSTVTKEFLALCEHNIHPGLAERVESLSAPELQATAHTMTLGVKKCKFGRQAINARDFATWPSWL